MSRLAPLDKALVCILVPLWLAWFALGVKTQVEGGGVPLLGVSLAAPDAHPALTGEYSLLYSCETDFDFSLIRETFDALLTRLFSAAGCSDNRGTPGADLFILNHFLTGVSGAPEYAERVNHDPALTDRAFLCGDFHGQIPNFVTVDYHDIGDVLAAVDALNEGF